MCTFSKKQQAKYPYIKLDTPVSQNDFCKSLGFSIKTFILDFANTLRMKILYGKAITIEN